MPSHITIDPNGLSRAFEHAVETNTLTRLSDSLAGALMLLSRTMEAAAANSGDSGDATGVLVSITGANERDGSPCLPWTMERTFADTDVRRTIGAGVLRYLAHNHSWVFERHDATPLEGAARLCLSETAAA